MTLVFDTETTGKANFNFTPDHPTQPRLVQIGAILFDEKWMVRAEMNLIVKPDGFEIPVEASGVHGITTEIAERFGVDERGALRLFNALAKKAKVLVAHNLDFDDLVLSAACAKRSEARVICETKFCTMQYMTDVCKIPGPYGFKWPKLQEAHRHCFNEGFEGAHDAMADVRACARIYKWIIESNKPTTI